MKKTIITIAAAAASLAFASCTKVEVPQEGYTITLLEQEVPKTTMTEGADCATFAWDNEDLSKFTIATYTDPATLNFASKVDAKIVDGKVVITATFPTAPAAGSKITGWMAHSSLSYSGRVWPAVPTVQTPLANQYDKAADILLINPIPVDGLSDVKFVFNRPVGIAKMTLKGLQPGTTVKSVDIYSTNHICNRRCQLNAAGVYGWGGSGQTLTCTLGKSADANGNLDVWYTIDPSISNGDKKLKITVKTAEGEITKDISSKIVHFEASKVTRFAVNFEGMSVVTKPITLSWTVLPSAGNKNFVWPFETTNDLPTSVAYAVHVSEEVVYNLRSGDTLYPFTFYAVLGLSRNSDARITFAAHGSNPDIDYIKFPVIDGYTITSVTVLAANGAEFVIDKFVDGEKVAVSEPKVLPSQTANSDTSMASTMTPVTWTITENNDGIQLGAVSNSPERTIFFRGLTLVYTPSSGFYGAQGAAGADAENVVITEIL